MARIIARLLLVHPVVPPEWMRRQAVWALVLTASAKCASGRLALEEWLLDRLRTSLALTLAARLDEVGDSRSQTPVIRILCKKIDPFVSWLLIFIMHMLKC